VANRLHEIASLGLAWVNENAQNAIRAGDCDLQNEASPRAVCASTLLDVHETVGRIDKAYLRLIDLKQIRWQDRAHFFAMSSRVMRRILVDVARANRSDKRGGDAPRVSLDEALLVSQEGGQDLVALDDALQALARVHPRKSEVVELRFFGGLSLEETAEALHVSIDTVKRDWRFAKLWLLRELSGH
jgi:RNA polymerase sigma factor (TIGR02999 family)